MPRIPDAATKTVSFLYRTKDQATEGAKSGGTGFFVSRIFEEIESYFVVSNIHVKNFCRFMRVNTTEGGVDVIEVPLEDWTDHPDGDDISVAPIRVIKQNWDIRTLKWDDVAATPSRMQELNVGVGDEIFMLGRFISHSGRERVTPLARFGSISMMPGELVTDGRGLKVEAYLVEMRSLSGFSGSPVFVHIGPGSYRGNGQMMPFFSETIGLIGIDTGHKSITTYVVKDGVKTDMQVDLNTGVAIVSPVSKLDELLHSIERK